MRNLSLARLLAVLTLSSFSAAAATLNNANFDADVLGDGAFTCGTITGWTSFGGGCGTGAFNPAAAHYPGGNAPPNDNVAYLNGTVGYWQQSTDVWTAGIGQTFSMLVGQRTDIPFLGYSLELWAGPATGGTLVASVTNGVLPGPGTFLPDSISFTPTGAESWLGQNVTVAFRGVPLPGGVQTNFHNAELTPTPEPGTYALVGTALAGLAVLRRRRS